MRFLSAAMAEEESEQAGLRKHFSVFCFAFTNIPTDDTSHMPHWESERGTLWLAGKGTEMES